MLFRSKQKTAYEIVYRDWSSDVCSSDLGITLPETNKARSGSVPFAGGETPTWLNDPKTGGQINDPMQVASANNTIDEENPGLWARLKNVWNNGIF